MEIRPEGRERRSMAAPTIQLHILGMTSYDLIFYTPISEEGLDAAKLWVVNNPGAHPRKA